VDPVGGVSFQPVEGGQFWAGVDTACDAGGVAIGRASDPGAAVEIRTLGVEGWAEWREMRLRALAEEPYAFGSTLAG